MLELNGIEVASIDYRPGEGLVVVLKSKPTAARLAALERDLSAALRESPFQIMQEVPTN